MCQSVILEIPIRECLICDGTLMPEVILGVIMNVRVLEVQEILVIIIEGIRGMMFHQIEGREAGRLEETRGITDVVVTLIGIEQIETEGIAEF